MKIYVITHSINEANERTSLSEVVSALSTKEAAWEELDKLNEKIEKGLSSYFPHKKVRGNKSTEYPIGYIYEWISDAGSKMFSHFNINETELK